MEAGRSSSGSGILASGLGCGSGILAGCGFGGGVSACEKGFACGGSGCGKPKNKFGISAGGRSAACDRDTVFCRAKNSGATIFNGNSNSMPSWTDADVGVGLIKGRKFRQVKVMRPRFNAGSIKFAGNETWASARFDCLISSLSPSGQFSESATNGAEMVPGSTGICGAGEGEGMGATGFGAPLLRGVIKLVAGVGV
jgi:hypothetical protein